MSGVLARLERAQCLYHRGEGQAINNDTADAYR